MPGRKTNVRDCQWLAQLLQFEAPRVSELGGLKKVEGATAAKRVAPSKSSRKFTGFLSQSGDPTALRLIASSKLRRATCELLDSAQRSQKP